MKKTEPQNEGLRNSDSFFVRLRAWSQARTQQEKAFMLLYLIVLTTILLIRLRLLSTPFERDEGEYAYIAQTLLHGGSLFKDAFTMKLPGTSMMYALWMLLFGESIEAVHVGLMLTNVLSAFLIVALVKKWGGSVINGITASIFFLMFTISQSALGFAAHATHFVMFYCLIALLFLESAMKRESFLLYFVSGLFFGLSLSMKQQGALFLLLPILFILQKKKIEPISWAKASLKLAVLFIGVIVPFATLSLYINSIGTFDKFYFWIFQYSSAYGGRVDPIVGSLILLNTLGILIERTPLFWLLSISGIVYSFALLKNPFAKRSLQFLAVGFLVVSPGFYFREHYFVAIFPALAMVASPVFDYIQSKCNSKGAGIYGSVFVLSILLFVSFAVEAPYYFGMSPEKVVERTYGKLNIFTTSKQISEYIKSNTRPEDKIQVLGSEPQIYFFSNRRSASGHIYMYGLMENQEYAQSMQAELAQDIMKQKPKFLVFSLEKSSWMVSANSNTWIWNWYKEYTARHYNIIGLGFFDKDSVTQYIWGDALKKNTVAPVVIISQRKD